MDEGIQCRRGRRFLVVLQVEINGFHHHKIMPVDELEGDCMAHGTKGQSMGLGQRVHWGNQSLNAH